MKSFLVFIVFVTFLYSQTPRVYTQLGDEIYANAPKIEELKKIKEFSRYINQIDVYISEVASAKEYGKGVEKEDGSADKDIYLEDLRELIKTNDFFKKLVADTFEDSIQKEKSVLFVQMIDSGLLPLSKYEEQILRYYNTHTQEIAKEGAIALLIEKQETLQQKRIAAQKAKEAVYYETKKETEQEKIERLRKTDLEKKEALRRALEEEEARKKAEIIQKQKEELAQ